MGINVTIDEKLIEEAKRLTGLSAGSEAIERILRQVVAGTSKHADLLDLAGKIKFQDGYDPRELRS